MHKRLSLEMGGKNAQIVLDDADLDLALDGVLWGAFGTTGQRCTATSRLILQNGHPRRVPRTGSSSARERCKLGDGRKKGTDVGPLINEDVAARRSSGTWTSGSARAPSSLCGGARADGQAARATATSSSRRSSRGVEAGHRGSSRRRSSGRCFRVIRVDDADEAFRVNNDVKYGLSSSHLHARRERRRSARCNELDNGITYVNAPTIGAEAHLPFGGVKQTGNGHREGGWEVYEFYSETKVGYVDFSGRCSGRRSTTTCGTPD